MKTPRLLPLFFTAFLAMPQAFAQVYQWKDANGRTIISDTPPAGAPKAQRVPLGGTTGSAPGKSLAEREMDFRKRQQEGKEKNEKDAKEQATNKERAENCERARRTLATLESGRRMTTVDGKGNTQFIDDEQRQREKEQATKAITDLCR